MSLRDASSLRLIFSSFLSDLMAFPRSMSLCVELLENVLGNIQNVQKCQDYLFFGPRFNGFDDSSFVRCRYVAFQDHVNDLLLSFGSDITLLNRFNDIILVHMLLAFAMEAKTVRGTPRLVELKLR